MHDLPQNELFSAYLDGELTAAEQADMEQLLATNPAARQLLDELRALSTTLQSLPREKLGEDLSGQVLRVAERRMLTEGGPDDAETAPMPLGRSIFQRFATRRNLVWLVLTASVAVMVFVNEQRQGGKPGVELARQMAKTPAAAEKAREPGLPPTIQAAHDVADETLERSDVQAERKLDRVAATDEYRADKLGMKSAERSTEPAAGSPFDQSVPQTLSKSVAKSEPPRAKRGAAIGKAARTDRDAEGANKFAEIDESVLVIHCDISQKAVESRAFDKLLDANGIARNEPRERIGGDEASKQKRAKDAKQLAMGDSFVYVEATPAQIAATLAGLTAQPDVFLAVSIQPAQDEQSKEMVRRYAGREQAARKTASGFGGGFQSKVAARSPAKSGKPAAVNGPATLDSAPMPAMEPLSQSPAPALVKSEAKNKKEATGTEQRSALSAKGSRHPDAQPAKDQRQLQKPSQPRLLAETPRQRVLFVVRVVDEDRSPVAAEVEPDTAAPAKEANGPAFKETAPPAESPTQDK